MSSGLASIEPSRREVSEISRFSWRLVYNHHGTSVMYRLFARFLKGQSGATAIEYGLIAAGIAVAIIAVVAGLGSQLNTTFSSVSSALR